MREIFDIFVHFSMNKPPGYAVGRKKALATSKKKLPFSINATGSNVNRKGSYPKTDKNSLSHTTWNYKYHVVFAAEYRRQLICG